MALAKYYEDNLEMYYERIEEKSSESPFCESIRTVATTVVEQSQKKEGIRKTYANENVFVWR